jgi:hypothetical protein
MVNGSQRGDEITFDGPSFHADLFNVKYNPVECQEVWLDEVSELSF